MCGLFGFSSYNNNVSKQKLDDLLNNLAFESQVRGTQATGIACKNSKHQLMVQKENKSASDVHFQISKKTNAVIGHTRHATQGRVEDNFNNHPFKGTLKNGTPFALAHNGVLTNDKILRTEKNLPKTKVETDSYVAVQLLEQNNAITHKALKEMAEAVDGSFSFTVIDNNDNLFFVKGDNPLSIVHFEKLGLYVYASTDEILWKALVDSGFVQQIKKGEYKEIPIEEGQILSISKDGKVEYSDFEYIDICHYPRWWYSGYSEKTDVYSTYLEDVRNLASYIGYSEDTVDRLLHQGFTLEEVEDFLYDEMDGFYP